MKPHQPKETLKFGATFTDHMLEMDHNDKKGWSAPLISPYHSIPCDPAMSVFHYGMEVCSPLGPAIPSASRA